MSKGKDMNVAKAVEEYLNRQNRPYSAVDIFNNLHKEYGKTAVVKACEMLGASGQIKEKLYNKQKVYVADQSQFPDVDDAEIKQMDGQIVQLTQTHQTSQTELKQLDADLRSLTSSLTTENASDQLVQSEKDCELYETKLKKLQSGGNMISPEEKDRVHKRHEKYIKEWRKRKRMTNDILNAILDGYPKSKKELYDDVGVETDEDYNVSPPT